MVFHHKDENENASAVCPGVVMETSLSIINDLGTRLVLETKDGTKRILRVATFEDLRTIPFHPKFSGVSLVPAQILLRL